MRTLQESIIGKKGRPFTAKDLISGDILVQNNGAPWYYTGKNFEHYKCGKEFPEPYISISYNRFFQSTDKNTFKDTSGISACAAYAIGKIYRSGNSIKHPNYELIEDFIRNNKPIWVSN